MRVALERRIGTLEPLGIALLLLVAAAVFFGAGSSDGRLVWLGGAAVVAATVAIVVASMRVLRPPALTPLGVLLLYAGGVALLLTFSRGGLAVGILVLALWFVVGRPRVESAAAAAIALVPMLAVVGWAFSRDGLTKDGAPHALQVHDGRWFG